MTEAKVHPLRNLDFEDVDVTTSNVPFNCSDCLGASIKDHSCEFANDAVRCVRQAIHSKLSEPGIMCDVGGFVSRLAVEMASESKLSRATRVSRGALTNHPRRLAS